MLKLLALTPFMNMAGCIYDDPPCGFDLNIFLHGFFFMEFQTLLGEQRLVVATPYTPAHHFGYWDHKDSVLHDFPSSFPWISDLQRGEKSSFPKEILKFANADIQRPVPFIPPPNSDYAMYMSLPLPGNIVPIRYGGDIQDFKMETTGKVCQSMYKRCGYSRSLSLITCLQFKTARRLDFRNINLYAEHCKDPSSAELNDAFCKAKNVFNAPQFDLHLVDEPAARTLPEPTNDDEKALCELLELGDNPCKTKCQVELIRTANCPQFGVL
jgi:hypothetical protein